MTAREWWDAVKREVAEILRDETSRRRSPKMAPARREVSSTSIPSMITAPGTSISIDPTLALAPTTSTTSTSIPTTTTVAPTTIVMTPTITAAPTATSQASDSDSSGGGISVAATAGIVIGALAGILVVFVLVYMVFSSRRKKLQRQRRQQIDDDEKINGPFADSAAIRPAQAKAPRLSLRPVTQFLPNFSSQSQAERRASRGIALTLNPGSNSSPLTRAPGGSAWDRHTNNPGGDHNRPDTSASLYPSNPFHDSQRIPEEPVSPVSSLGSFDHNRVGLATTTDAMPEPVSPIGGDDEDRQLGGAPNHNKMPASSLTRKTSIRKDLPKPLDLTKPPSPLYAVPPSPAGTEYSMHSVGPGQSPGPSASAAAIAAAGGPTSSTVHRVQLDFKPTLQDEMELRAGQLVRLLHEYDDGWALCIRLDRSQQGVVPRTCLSTRPVKPRPAGNGGSNSISHAHGNPRGGPPINPSFHHHQHTNSATSNYSNPGPGPAISTGRRPSSPTSGFPPVPVAKDAGYGRPRSPLGGSGRGNDAERRSPGGDYPDMSPAPGQAY